MLKPGLYIAQNNDSIYDAYTIKMKVKETDKTFIFELVELSSRFSAPHMKKLFQNSKKFWLRKSRGGHGIQCWGDSSFTFYPYQAGIPYVFNLVSDEAVIGPKQISDERTRKAFERFKLQWMIDHGYTLADLVECMEIMIHEDAISGLRTNLSNLFDRWEFGVGFADGSVWPCYEEYLQYDAVESEGKFMLVTVCERDITTAVFPSFAKARKQMMGELKDEFLKGNDKDEWEKYENLTIYEGNDFSFTETTAWSNLDDDQLCDWLIVPLA